MMSSILLRGGAMVWWGRKMMMLRARASHDEALNIWMYFISYFILYSDSHILQSANAFDVPYSSIFLVLGRKYVKVYYFSAINDLLVIETNSSSSHANSRAFPTKI